MVSLAQVHGKNSKLIDNMTESLQDKPDNLQGFKIFKIDKFSGFIIVIQVLKGKEGEGDQTE